MKFLSISIFVFFILFISCNSDPTTKDEIVVPSDHEKGEHLFTIKGVLVGSSGSYVFVVNENLSLLTLVFEGKSITFAEATSNEIKNIFNIKNDYLFFEARIDKDGSPHTNIVIPSHNEEIATTASISAVGYKTEPSFYLPKIDSNMANYEGTIESKLSKDNGENFQNNVYQSSIYNITLNNGKVSGLLKCETCLNDTIYNISGDIISSSDTMLSLKINSIKNRATDSETLLQPLTETYTKYSGGLLLKLEEEKTIGVDSILKSERLLKYVE